MGRLGVIALAALLALAVGASPSRALENGLARTPPMGWNAFYSLLGLHARRYHARELWAHRTHTILRWIRARVPSHGVALFRVTPGH